MGEPKALLATALSPPNVSDIERTILHLKEVGISSNAVEIRVMKMYHIPCYLRCW